MTKAHSAPSEAVVELVLDDAGLPRLLSLDPIPNAVDDEECYEVSRLKGIESAIGQADRLAGPNDGERAVTLGSVVVSVPDTWVSTRNGCERALGRGTHVHAPGTLGTRTCGTVPSLTVVSTDSAPGRALIRYPLEERTINGVQVRVGDSCLPTAACFFPNGLVAHVPADDVVLVVSAGSQPSSSLARRVVDSIHISAESVTE